MADIEKRKNGIIKLTNNLLSSCNINKKVNSIDELNSTIYVKIYESVCASELVDKITPIKTVEDEIHNIQAVIDSISLDILHEDLSHITGEAVINKDLVSIEYLLDILISIQEWLSSSSTSSSRNNLSQLSDSTNSSTIVTTNEDKINNNNNNIKNMNNKSIDRYSDILSTSVTSNISLNNKKLKDKNNNSSSGIGGSGSLIDLNEKEKQINNLKSFLDNSQNSIKLLTKAKDNADKQIKYLELEREMENTVRMTQDALNNNLPPSLATLTNTITSSVLSQQQQQQKQVINNEAMLINNKKQVNDDNWFNLVENDSANILLNKNNKEVNLSSASSSSSSINGVGVLGEMKRKKQEILEKYSNKNNNNSFENYKNEKLKHLKNSQQKNHQQQQQQKQQQQPRKVVKFNDDLASDGSNNNSRCSSSSRSDLILNKKTQQFDTTNELSIIRNTIQDNTKKDDKMIKYLLKSVYEDDLKDAESIMRQSLDKIKNKSEMTNNLYLDAHRPVSARTTHVPMKSVLFADDYKKPIRRVSRVTSLSPSRHKNNHLMIKRSSSNSSRKSKFIIGEDGILSKLLEEFPYLYLSPETIHDLWNKHSKQIEHLQREQHSLETKYSQENENTNVKKYLTETHNKQKVLMDIMCKELLHMQRVQDLKRKQNVENTLKCKARDQRFQNVKVKKYFEEFRLQQRAKMLKKVTKEEVLFKKLFNESLKIQKERVREMQKYAKEQRDIKTKQQLNQIESIENFYKNKFNLLNEQLKKEKVETEIREKAQHEILNKMKNQLRQKLESDIRDLQGQLCNDDDFMYWRELDAKRVEDDLKLARYKTTV